MCRRAEILGDLGLCFVGIFPQIADPVISRILSKAYQWIPTTFDEYTAIVNGISPGQKILFFAKIYGGFELSGIAKLQIESVDVEFSDGSCGSCCYGWYITF